MTNANYSLESVQVLDSAMEVFVFTPDDPSATKNAAIVLAQHIPVGHTGVENDEFTLATAARFAAAGYVVAVPFIFHWWPKSADIKLKRDESRDDWQVADMTAAYRLLAERDDVDSTRISVVGHCWGGRIAWLAACHLPDLMCCAVFYGGRVKTSMGGDHAAPIDLVADIRCPVVGFFGDDDSNPSPSDVDDYAAALAAAGVPHVFHRYADAGHAFQNFPTPERYREAASEDAWERVLRYLRAAGDKGIHSVY